MYFSDHGSPHMPSIWMVYGIGTADDCKRKIYKASAIGPKRVRHRDQFAVAACLDPQHAETVLFIVMVNALDEARQHFRGGMGPAAGSCGLLRHLLCLCGRAIPGMSKSQDKWPIPTSAQAFSIWGNPDNTAEYAQKALNDGGLANSGANRICDPIIVTDCPGHPSVLWPPN